MDHLIECGDLPEYATTEQCCAWLESVFGPPWDLAALLEDGLRPTIWIDDCAPWRLGFGAKLSGPEILRLKVSNTVRMSGAEAPDGAIHDFRPPRDFALSAIRFSRHDLVHFAETCGLPALPVHFAENDDLPGQVKSAAPATPSSVGVVTHSTKPARRDTLDPVIEHAQGRCKDPQDTAQVWAQLQRLAQDEHAPLLAATHEGLKYTKNGDAAYFTRDALDKRLHPERRAKRR